MKIREGFVSNSSSASYIVKIKGVSFEEFAETLSGAGFCISNYIDEINKALEEIEEELAEEKRSESNADNEKFREFRITMTENGIEKCKDTISKCNNAETSVESMKAILGHYGIRIQEDKFDNNLILHYWTAMHNDFDSGMGSLMKEILFMVMFETDYKVKCEVRHD